MSKTQIALALVCLATIGVATQTKPTLLSDRLLAKAKEVYGEAAPAKITFVTAPRPPWKSGDTDAWSVIVGKTGGEVGQRTPYTAVGDSATGTSLSEDGNQAFVDASPCEGKVMVFTQPYTKTPASPTTCAGKPFTRFKFVQK